jgi:hypothetical protein
MYGTVAKVTAKPGALEALRKMVDERRRVGHLGTFVYQSDHDPNEYWLAVLFESKEAYIANADSLEQNQEYLELRSHLLADPEWHDGEVVVTSEMVHSPC